MKLDEFDNLLWSFTTREFGGNLAFHVEDDPVKVDSNHMELSKKLGFKKEKLVHMKQIHSNDVHCVNENDCYAFPPTCDALMTNKKDIPLMVMVADCTPVLFYDPTCKTIGVAHVGRAGAFSNIIANIIVKMHDEYGSKASDLVVSIGPAIGSCCYEVGIDIYESVKDELAYAFELRDNRYFLDINKIIIKQLQECGVKNENIENEKRCTSCHKDRYFSYRAEGKTGRFAGILMLR